MRGLVLGGDGYGGRPTTLHLSLRDDAMGIADDFARRGDDPEMGGGTTSSERSL